GALIFGQMRLAGDDREQQSLQQHEHAMIRLEVDPERRVALREFLLSAKLFSDKRVVQIRKTLVAIERWFDAVSDEEAKIKRDMSTVIHELQTRVQAIVAEAENLAYACDNLTDAQRQAQELLRSSLALDTVVQNVGS